MTPKAENRQRSRYHNIDPPPLRVHEEDDDGSISYSKDSRSSRGSTIGSSIANDSQSYTSTSSSTLDTMPSTRRSTRSTSASRRITSTTRGSSSDKYRRGHDTNNGVGRSGCRTKPNLLLPSLLSPDPQTRTMPMTASSRTRNNQPHPSYEHPNGHDKYRSQPASPRHHIHHVSKPMAASQSAMRNGASSNFSPRRGYSIKTTPAATTTMASPASSYRERRTVALAEMRSSNKINIPAPLIIRTPPSASFSERPSLTVRSSRPAPLSRHQSEPLSYREFQHLPTAPATAGAAAADYQHGLPPFSPRQYSSSLASRMANLQLHAESNNSSSGRHPPTITRDYDPRMTTTTNLGLNIDNNMSRLPNNNPYGSTSLTPKSLHEQERFNFNSYEQHQYRSVDSLSLAHYQTIQERQMIQQEQMAAAAAAASLNHQDEARLMTLQQQQQVPTRSHLMGMNGVGNSPSSSVGMPLPPVVASTTNTAHPYPTSMMASSFNSGTNTAAATAASAHTNNHYSSNANHYPNMQPLQPQTPSKVRFTNNVYERVLEDNSRQQKHHHPMLSSGQQYQHQQQLQHQSQHQLQLQQQQQELPSMMAYPQQHHQQQQHFATSSSALPLYESRNDYPSMR
mmetsp:Transcript_6727/g.15312  ORF Transcript_6727/g.15312 Transcript_6727/m.15312 type:complete len:624 (-) Transcript_6727:150-2021(-)